MPSIRARMIKLLLQNRHLFKSRLKKETVDWNQYEAILNFRREVEEGAGKFGRLPAGMEVVPVTIEEMKAEWLLPAGAAKEAVKNKVILYFHGGGYVSGTCRAHRSIVAKFVQGSGTGALLFEYRLAPENPYPAALDDAVKAYRWLLNQGNAPENIVFVGDSGGGGLCLAALLYLRDQGIPLPAAAVAYSPYTDLKCTGESHRSKVKVCLAPEGTAQAFGRHYAGDHDLDLPYISPLYGNLEGLPPILIFVGGDETLLDDSVRFAEKARNAGVDITLRIGEGLFHCYPAMSPLFPEAREAMEEICTFITKRTAG